MEVLQGHESRCYTSSHTGNKWVMEVLQGHESRCYNAFRMNKEVFYRLCGDLEAEYGVLGSNRTSHIEVVALTLYILAQGYGFRSMGEHFQHSTETIMVMLHKKWKQ